MTDSEPFWFYDLRKAAEEQSRKERQDKQDRERFKRPPRNAAVDTEIADAFEKLSALIPKMLADRSSWDLHWPAFFWMQKLARNILLRHIRNAPKSQLGVPDSTGFPGDPNWKKASRLTSGMIHVWKLFKE